MKRNILSVILLIGSLQAPGQSIFVDAGSDGFTINFKKLAAKDKTCFLVNCIKSGFVDNSQNLTIKPLIVLKAFDCKAATGRMKSVENLLSLQNYCDKFVVPALIKDMEVNLTTLQPIEAITPVNTFDSLIILKNGKFEVYTGLRVAEFFNLVSFPQASVLQTNRTIFNEQATVVSIQSWTGDSIPNPAVDEMIGQKVFLLKKSGNEFTFFCHPSFCDDCPLNFYNEYIYRKDYGVVAFKSKYVFRDRHAGHGRSRIEESDDYYYFR